MIDSTDLVVIGADAIHLIHEGKCGEPRNGLPGAKPFRTGAARLQPHQKERRRRQDTQDSLHFDREVNVTGSINDVDAAVFPETMGGGRCDRDATFPFLRHVVHYGFAIMNLTDLVGHASVVKDRSVQVVFPASIWATIPILRILSKS